MLHHLIDLDLGVALVVVRVGADLVRLALDDGDLHDLAHQVLRAEPGPPRLAGEYTDLDGQPLWVFVHSGGAIFSRQAGEVPDPAGPGLTAAMLLNLQLRLLGQFSGDVDLGLEVAGAGYRGELSALGAPPLQLDGAQVEQLLGLLDGRGPALALRDSAGQLVSVRAGAADTLLLFQPGAAAPIPLRRDLLQGLRDALRDLAPDGDAR